MQFRRVGIYSGQIHMIEHADISHLSGFHTLAKARYFIEYDGKNLGELKAAAHFATEKSLPILTISGGKNLLLAFDEYPGLVIFNHSQGFEFIQNIKDTMQVASGQSIWELAEALEKKHNITFWHRFLGLPGSV